MLKQNVHDMNTRKDVRERQTQILEKVTTGHKSAGEVSTQRSCYIKTKGGEAR